MNGETIVRMGSGSRGISCLPSILRVREGQCCPLRWPHLIRLSMCAPAVQAIDYGTQMVAGVNPKKDGQVHLGLPIFKSVRDAAENTGACPPFVEGVAVPLVPESQSPRPETPFGLTHVGWGWVIPTSPSVIPIFT